MRRLALLALLAPAAALAAWPLGTELDPALMLDVTPAGFDMVSDVVSVLVPDTVAIPPIHYEDKRCEFSVFGACVLWTYKYSLDVTKVKVSPSIRSLDITPATNKLDLDANLDIAINSAGDPLLLAVNATILEIIGIGGLNINQKCNAYLDKFPVDIAGDIKLQVIPDGAGGRKLDATVSPLAWGWNISGKDINLWAAPGSSCTVSDIRNFFVWFGWDPFDLVLDYAEDALDDTIQDLRPEIEAQIEEIFASASISQEVEIGDATLLVDIEPSAVTIKPEGMRIETAGSFATDVHPCVLPYLGAGSLETSSGDPALGSAPAGVPSPHHVGILVSDDFVNNGLYGAWAGGLLCQTLQEDAGIPINTTLLNILSSEAYAELFPETKPMIIKTRPMVPPQAIATGASDLQVDVKRLGVDMYAELDHRMTRALGAELEARVGVDFGFDGTTGEMLVDIEFSPKDVDVAVVSNDYAPGQDALLESKFSGLLDTVVGPLIGNLISDIRFAMPAFEGIGLTSLDPAPSGPAKDWFGFYAQAGVVTYEAGGCDDDGGGSCAGGCGGSNIPSRPVLFLLPLLAAALRRRR